LDDGMASDHTTIRRARLDDYDEACRLLDALDVFHRERVPWLFKEPSRQPRSEAHFADLLAGAASAVFVADAGRLVGIAVGLIRTAPDFPIFVQQRWGVLDALVVDPAWRRRGIGALLANSVETWAIEAGAPWVEVNVYDANAEARRFYEARGYLPVSTKMRKPTASTG
jgi:GNAT superfamily N-acetyltransferase